MHVGKSKRLIVIGRAFLRYNSRVSVPKSNSSAYSNGLVPSPNRLLREVLDISPFDVAKEISIEEKEQRTPNIHTSILINSFFQSVMQNDFNRSRKLAS